MPKANIHRNSEAESVFPESSPPKTPKRRTKKQAEPEVPITDESRWPPSEVPEKQKICKTYALHQYKLTEKDLQDLPYDMSEAVVPIRGENDIVPMKLYRERDIERIAWKKRGGPERFEAYLNKRRASWFSKPRKGEWAEPTKYGSPQEAYTELGPSRPAGVRRDTWAVTPELVRKKRYMKTNGHLWLWDECNKALDSATIYSKRVREVAFLRIGRSMNYPPRPSAEPPTSTSFDALREVLKDAPVSQGEYTKVDGIDYCYHGETGDTSLFWAQEYLDRLFTALIGIIKEYGLGENGWKRARWLVYDTYSRSFQAGIWYNSREEEFVDEAYDWLSGWLAPFENAITTRMDGRSEIGKAYNRLLPKLSPGQ